MKHPTYTATFIPDESMIKGYREWIHPLCRPRRISPKKRVKWRLVKKWFNRFEKSRYNGIVLRVQAVGGEVFCMITEVKIKKGGKRNIDYCMTAAPITEYKELEIP